MSTARSVVLVVAVLLSCLCCGVVADTPANCSYAEIIGSWDFHVGPPSPYANISCASFTPASTYSIQLSYPDVVTDSLGHTGFFTLIYNQGFEVRIAGQNFFAFSNWTSGRGDAINSNCNQTFNGWAHAATTPESAWRCYYGVRTAAGTPPPQFSTPASPPSPTQPARCAADGSAAEATRKSRRFVHDQAFVDAVNAAQSSFTVGRYPEFEGLTIGEIEQRAGASNLAADPAAFLQSMQQAGEGAVASSPQPARGNRHFRTLAADAPMPESWDWRNVSGVNYVSPVRDQGSCGSCYIYSSVGMLESRIRIATRNRVQPLLSTQDALSCSRYSQGCAGGFPYLTAGKYAQDFGFVEEACFPYTGTDTTSCARKCTDPARLWRVSNYSYIGGYYGACTAEKMQREIMEHGPISVSFQVYNDFTIYTGGIYTHAFTRDITSEFNPSVALHHLSARHCFLSFDGRRATAGLLSSQLCVCVSVCACVCGVVQFLCDEPRCAGGRVGCDACGSEVLDRQKQLGTKVGPRRLLPHQQRPRILRSHNTRTAPQRCTRALSSACCTEGLTLCGLLCAVGRW